MKLLNDWSLKMIYVNNDIGFFKFSKFHIWFFFHQPTTELGNINQSIDLYLVKFIHLQTY